MRTSHVAGVFMQIPRDFAGDCVRAALRFEFADIAIQFAGAIESCALGCDAAPGGRIVAHTATARNKDWDVTIPAKGVGHITLEHPGDLDYFCRFHPNMMGQISVIP